MAATPQERLRTILSSALSRKAVFPIELVSVLPCLLENQDRRIALRAQLQRASPFVVEVLGVAETGAHAAVVGSEKASSVLDVLCNFDVSDDEVDRIEEYVKSYRPKEFAYSGEPIFRDFGVGIMADAAKLDGLAGGGTAIGCATFVPYKVYDLPASERELLHRLLSTLGNLTLFVNTLVSQTEVQAKLSEHRRTIELMWAAMRDLGAEPRDPKTHDVLTVVWLLDHATRGERWGDPDNTRSIDALVEDFYVEAAEMPQSTGLVGRLDRALVVEALQCWYRNHGKWDATATLLSNAGLSNASGESLRVMWSKQRVRRRSPT